MLRTYVTDFDNAWDTHFPLVEFSYINNYHTSIKAALFESLQGRKCHSPLYWIEDGNTQLARRHIKDTLFTVPKIIQETKKKMVQIKETIKSHK